MTAARLAGRVALVTGGARGLGVHYCRALAAAGATVVALDIVDPLPGVHAVTSSVAAARDTADPPPGVRAAAESGEFIPPIALRADVSDETAVQALVREVMQRFGRVDILVNNAAVASILRPVEPTELDVELWDRVMAVNVRGPFLMAKHVAKIMIPQRSGKIINISSGVAYKGAKGLVHYVTSKAAVLGLTRALARDLGAYGICVNTIAPGLIVSDSLLANQPDMEGIRRAAATTRSLAHEGEPRDLLGTLLFLASTDSDFVTGQTIVLDGGTLML
jgi:NAD(P)-dependent dehydrogenase (short-subunit alcohol dehydrogenase family)